MKCKKFIKVKQFIYDGYIFNYTDEALAAQDDIIGFYFDALGHAHSIYRDSIFGAAIKAVNENKF
jgi:hypothetical protein